jgi:hypothetical protein
MFSKVKHKTYRTDTHEIYIVSSHNDNQYLKNTEDFQVMSPEKTKFFKISILSLMGLTISCALPLLKTAVNHKSKNGKEAITSTCECASSLVTCSELCTVVPCNSLHLWNVMKRYCFKITTVLSPYQDETRNDK